MEDNEETGYGLLTYLGISVTVGAVIFYRLKRLRMLSLASKLPGPKGIPLIGNALEFMDGPHNIILNLVSKNEFDDVVKLWLGPRLVVMLSHPADIELVLKSQLHLDKSPEYDILEPWLGNGIHLTSGEKWSGQRKLVSPMFHPSILKSFIPLFNRISKEAVEKMKKEQGRYFDCHDYMSEATIRMLMESTIGLDGSSQESRDEYIAAVKEMCDVVNMRQLNFWLRPDIFFMMSKYGRTQKRLLNVIHTHTKKVLNARKAEYQRKNLQNLPGNGLVENHDAADSSKIEDRSDHVSDNGRVKTFLDYLIESAQGGVVLFDELLRQHIDTIIFKGHETTAAACSFFLCIMVARPDIQSKVLEELSRIFGDSDREATLEDIQEMKYLERCIMETMRLYPPMPLIARQLQLELKLASTDAILPADCTVMLSIYRLHRRPELYTNPDHFDPDHFLPERCASRHYYSYIPFSAGPRSCLGRTYAMLKMKILLSSVLRNYRIVSGQKQEDSWLLRTTTSLFKTDGYKIKIQPRTMKAH